MTESLEVELREVSHSFESDEGEVNLIEGLSLSVGVGNFVSVIGPDGCGKSTIAKMVAGLVQPSKGTVWLGGEQVTSPRRTVGIVFRDPALLEWMTLVQNVALPLEVMAPDMPSEEREERAGDLLRLVSLEGYEKMRPAEVSTGIRMRAALCRALVHYPELLILDEAFEGVGIFERESLWETIQLLREMEPFTGLMFTQSLREAVFLSDEVVVLSDKPAKSSLVAKVEFNEERKRSFIHEHEVNKLMAKLREQIEAAVAGIELEAEEDSK